MGCANKRTISKMLYCYENKIKKGSDETKQYLLDNFSFDKVASKFYSSFEELKQLGKSPGDTITTKDNQCDSNNGILPDEFKIYINKCMGNN